MSSNGNGGYYFITMTLQHSRIFFLLHSLFKTPFRGNET